MIIYDETIQIRATGKARPRCAGRRTYMPKNYKDKQKELKAKIGFDFNQLSKSEPIFLYVFVQRAIPKSASKRKAEKLKNQYHLMTPDTDNTIGWVMDTLFEDDSHVVAHYCEKRYSEDNTDYLRIVVSDKNLMTINLQ